MAGTLYVCATPIGNLEDITLRALLVLRTVDLIAAEDTRRTRKLLSHHGISKPLVSYHEHNKAESAQKILSLVGAGRDVALVTDAGVPGVSDPGSDLVRECVAQGVKVVPVPGPSAVTAALSASGTGAAQFIFLGFLPRAKKALRQAIGELAGFRWTIVFYEAPHRLVDTLSEMAPVLGERHICIAREMSKVHEEFFRGTVAEARDAFAEREVLGEITVVLEGLPRNGARQSGRQGSEEQEGGGQNQATVDVGRQLRSLMDKGVSLAEAVQTVSANTGVSRNAVYKIALDIRRNT
jgi:16S rRNA (cytidine1402-2'-O)-methyltransferase